ncbi:hypothetical protein J3R74_000872 [Puniceicoccus vermicola]
MQGIEAKELWMVPALLLLPGIYLLWFTIRKREFFRLGLWKRWSGYPSLFAFLLEFPNRAYGPSGARIALGFVACCIIFLSGWISLVLYR